MCLQPVDLEHLALCFLVSGLVMGQCRHVRRVELPDGLRAAYEEAEQFARDFPDSLDPFFS